VVPLSVQPVSDYRAVGDGGRPGAGCVTGDHREPDQGDRDTEQRHPQDRTLADLLACPVPGAWSSPVIPLPP
jgi:hypothetical protein